MTDPAETEKRILAMLRQVFDRHRGRLRGYRILLFGSRATGRARERSDFDLGVIGDRPLPLTDFYAIEEDIEQLPTLYRIDWVDLNRASPILKEEALKEGKVIYEA
ncbi:hypothetical protein JCM13664_02860 [Methylothermus subterraneus]